MAIAVLASLPALAPAAGAADQVDGTGLLRPTAAQGATTTRTTLVTGDTVEIAKDAQGRESVQVTSVDGASRTFETMTGAGGDLYVFPSDANDALASGAVDRELFNVTRLIRDGYADSRTDTLPVIVGYADKPSDAALAKRAADLPDSTRGAVIRSVDMAGVSVAKKDAEHFWAAVKPVAKAPKNGRAVTAPGASHVARLYYDAKVRPVLDQSVPQIGAPEAWARGYDGTGVKVAVLDTGVDLNHPDVKDRVTGKQSFVPSLSTVADGHGHGTHVASTIAGSGAASGGRYKGVAPGADLLIGKVLDNSGSGDTSWVAAGMEWAAAQGADVVSMSLGATARTLDDPLTQTVDRLSATTGTLFVVAAGNDGPGAGTVGSPGIADSALTVGAVTKTDVMAGFSSRGPRVVDYAVKPDVTAPGVGIVAARAAGTAMGTVVDANYTSANGTSMATPHVSGAVALLKQRHPDWTGQRIKAALAAHAKPGSGTVYDEGAGRIDVPAALDPRLEIAGSTDFGLLKWQATPYETRTRTVTVSNDGDTATTVTPSISGAAGGAGLSVSGPVEVPAHGSAQVTVTLDPNGIPAGDVSGALVLTASDGATAHTALGAVKETERHHLKVTFKDRHGTTPKGGRLTVMDLATGTISVLDFVGGDIDLPMPPGRYSVAGMIRSTGAGDAVVDYATDLFNVPSVDVTEDDAAVTVDGTKAHDIGLKVRDETRPLERSTFSYQINRIGEGGAPRQLFGLFGLTSWSQERYGAIPAAAPAAGDGKLYVSVSQTYREPVLRAKVIRPGVYDLTARTSSYLKRFDGHLAYDVVDVGGGTPEELAGVDLAGKAALVHLPVYTPSLVRAVAAAGPAAIVLAPTRESTLGLVVANVNVPYFAVPYDEGRRLTADAAAGRATVAIDGVLESRYHYAAHVDYLNGIPADLTADTARADYAKLRTTYHSDGAARTGDLVVHTWGSYPLTSFQTSEVLRQPAERDDYVLALPASRYSTMVIGSGQMTEPGRTYKPGTSLTRHWNGPVMHPSLVPTYSCSFCRFPEGMIFIPRPGGDGDPTHYLNGGRQETWRYFRNGELMSGTTGVLVPEKARYTFESTNVRPTDSEGLKLGRKVVTSYTFDSVAPTSKKVQDCELTIANATVCEAVPVILLDYGMEASPLNDVGAGLPFSMTFDAARARGYTGSGDMAGARFSVSYDDGATWQSAAVSRLDGNSFKADFKHPALADTNGFVSIRAEVWDADGGRTVQTVTRAYALR